MEELDLSITSEAADRVRSQLEKDEELVREDVADLLDDYDALDEVYMRVMRNLATTAQSNDQE